MKQHTHWGMVLTALLLAGSLLAGAAVAWLRAAAGALAGTVLTATAPAADRPAAQTELPEGYWYGVTLSADALPGGHRTGPPTRRIDDDLATPHPVPARRRRHRPGALRPGRLRPQRLPRR